MGGGEVQELGRKRQRAGCLEAINNGGFVFSLSASKYGKEGMQTYSEREWICMSGWNNPLPIGQRARSLARGWWEKGLVRAGASFPGGRSPSTYTGRAITLSGVGDLQARYNSRSLFSDPPPMRPIRRPHCHLGIYRWQRSQVTRAATFPQCLRQWTYERSVREGWYC